MAGMKAIARVLVGSGVAVGVWAAVALGEEGAGPLAALAPERSAPVASAASFDLPEKGVLLDSYAAIVKDKVITMGDVLSAAAPLQARAAATLQGKALASKLAEIYSDVRDDLVGVELVLLEFEAIGGTLPEHAIEDHVGRIIKERFHGSQAELLAALGTSRMTLAEWREEMRKQLIVQVMRAREVDSKVSISPIDVQQEYDRNAAAYARPEQVRLDVVSIRAPRMANQDEVGQARELYRRLLRVSYGRSDEPVDVAALQESFPRLDVRYEPAEEWMEVDSMAPAFRDSIREVPTGRVASPVELQGRAYFLRVIERKEAATVPLEEAAPAIEKKLRAEAQDRLMKAWTDSLKSKYHVQLFEQAMFQAPEGFDEKDE